MFSVITDLVTTSVPSPRYGGAYHRSALYLMYEIRKLRRNVAHFVRIYLRTYLRRYRSETRYRIGPLGLRLMAPSRSGYFESASESARKSRIYFGFIDMPTSRFRCTGRCGTILTYRIVE